MPKCNPHFLDWSKPLSKQAAEYLLKGRTAPTTHAIDFSDTILVVQTRNAGRRLKEALVREAGEGKGLLSLNILTPEQLPREFGELDDAASNLEIRLAWLQLIQKMKPRDFPNLFPILPDEPDLEWGWVEITISP